jgi:flagellar assembly protein FliH
MTSSPEPTRWALPELAAPGSRSRDGLPAGAPTGIDGWQLPELPDARADQAAGPRPVPTEWDQAYDRGLAAGLTQGAARAEQRIRPAMEALAQATLALGEAQEEFARERVRDLECLALAVARKLIQRELKTDPALVRDLVARAIELLPLDHALELHLNPADLAALTPHAEALMPRGRALTLQWVPDPTLEPGSFLVESPLRIVDGRTDVALRTLYERLDHD